MENNAVEVSYVSYMSRIDETYSRVWGTKAPSALMREVSNKCHQMSMCADLAAKVHSMVVLVEALAIGDELVIEDDA